MPDDVDAADGKDNSMRKDQGWMMAAEFRPSLSSTTPTTVQDNDDASRWQTRLAPHRRSGPLDAPHDSPVALKTKKVPLRRLVRPSRPPRRALHQFRPRNRRPPLYGPS